MRFDGLRFSKSENGLERFDFRGVWMSGLIFGAFYGTSSNDGLNMKCRVAAGKRFGTVCAILVFLKLIDFASFYGFYCRLCQYHRSYHRSKS